MSQSKRRSLGATLLEYTERGWFLFPVSQKTKKPAIKDNLKSASNDIVQLMEWANSFPNCNWAVSLAKSGLVAIDIDDKHGGLDKWAALVVNNGEPETLKAQSGSGKGLHYLFLSKAGVSYKGKITDGIDVKHNGYVLVNPSVHPRTQLRYSWTNNTEIGEYPHWLSTYIEKKTTPRKNKGGGLSFGAGFYHKVVEQLKQKVFGYDEWLRLGMALHSAFQGSEEGLELYLDLTEGVNFKAGDLEQARSKYDSFKADDAGVGNGTFIYLARELGCDIPNPDLDKDKELFKAAIREDAEKEAEENPGWFDDDQGRRLTRHAEFLVEYFNKEGYALLTGEGEGQIIRSFDDDSGLLQVKTLNQERFRTALAPYWLKTYVEGVGGELRPKYKNAADVWLQSDERKEFADVVFRPNAPENCLNLWAPIPCERIEGDVDKLLWFIETIICAGNKSKANYVVQYLAHLMQRPEEKTSVVLCLIGEEGTGKGFFTEGLLRGIFKRYYTVFNKPGTIKDKFNKDQARKLLTVLDEAAWRGDFELVNLLKSLTGNATITVEEKFGGRITIDNFTRYMVTSNDEDAVKVGRKNRRYLILNVSDKYLEKDEVYSDLWDGVKKGNLCAHFYDYLLKVDLSEFNPFKFPKHLDTGGLETKLKSLSSVGRFWWEVMVDDPKPLFHQREGALVMNKNEVFQYYDTFSKTLSRWDARVGVREFWKESKHLVPALGGVEFQVRNDGSDRLRVFRIPPQDFMNALADALRVPIPDEFDELSLISDTEKEDRK